MDGACPSRSRAPWVFSEKDSDLPQDTEQAALAKSASKQKMFSADVWEAHSKLCHLLALCTGVSCLISRCLC